MGMSTYFKGLRTIKFGMQSILDKEERKHLPIAEDRTVFLPNNISYCEKCHKEIIYEGKGMPSLCIDCMFPDVLKEKKSLPSEIIIKNSEINVENQNLIIKNNPKPINLSEFIGQTENKKSIETSLKIIKQVKPINIFIHGYPGCLSGDTFINYQVRNNNKVQNVKGGTLENLYHRFNKIPKKGKGYNQRNQTINSDFFLPSFNELTTEIFINKIKSVIYSGKKETYLVTTKLGKFIKATLDHEFFIGTGYTQLSNLKIGDTIYVHTKHYHKSTKAKRVIRKEITVKYNPRWNKRLINNCVYYRTRVSRAIYEAWLNNIQYAEYINLLNSGNKKLINKLKFIPNNMDVHHIDENPNNDIISNLELLTKNEHYLKHKQTIDKRIKMYLIPDTIINIVYQGIEDTYDVSMIGTCRNLIANNIAVHNCGKTTLAEIIAHELDAKFIYSIPEQLKNFERVSEILNEIQTNKDLTVWMIDEAHNLDKKLINILLPILQDHKLGNIIIREFVMVFATTDYNKLYKKSEALISRFQTKIYLEKYSNEDIITILKQHKKKMDVNVEIPDNDYLLIAQNCKRIPREAINLLLKRLVLSDMPEIFKENKIVHNGLNQKDIQILNCLNEITLPIGSNFLSQRVGLIEADYCLVYEPFLIESGLIDRTARGRIISAKGKELICGLNA